MPRPKLKDESKRRKGISISLRSDILDKLEKEAENKSKYIEASIEACEAISIILSKHFDNDYDPKEALEDIDDAISVFLAQKIEDDTAQEEEEEAKKNQSSAKGGLVASAP